MQRISSIVLFVFMFCFFNLATADVPQLISYQGYLTDSEGAPLDDTFAMTFSIYEFSTGGSPIWTETQSSVIVTEGLFNVLLGSVDLIEDNVFNNADRYLGIAVGADPEQSPRTRLVSVPFAHHAQVGGGWKDSADMVVLADETDSIRIGPEHEDSWWITEMYGPARVEFNGDLSERGTMVRIINSEDSWPEEEGNILELFSGNFDYPIFTLGPHRFEMSSSDYPEYPSIHLESNRDGFCHFMPTILLSGAFPPQAGSRALIISERGLRLEPAYDFPSFPDEGDITITGSGDDRHLYAYLNGDWQQTDTGPAFGDWQSRSLNTVYLAATDGMVLASCNTSDLERIVGYTDGSNPPTTARIRNNAVFGGSASITMPVKKGDYWKVVPDFAPQSQMVYWLPMGN